VSSLGDSLFLLFFLLYNIYKKYIKKEIQRKNTKNVTRRRQKKGEGGRSTDPEEKCPETAVKPCRSEG
jgi:hypothetical protein